MDHQPCLTVSAQAVSLAARISALLERYTITQEAAVSLIKSKRSSQLQRSKVILCLYQYALFPIRVDGSRGKEKNFFSREKAERRHRSFLLSPNPSPLFKKSGVFCKVESSPLLEIIYPYGEQSQSSRRLSIIWTAVLSHHRTCRSAYGGSVT